MLLASKISSIEVYTTVRRSLRILTVGDIADDKRTEWVENCIRCIVHIYIKLFTKRSINALDKYKTL